MNNKFCDILIGLFLCVILEKHAIAAIVGENPNFTSLISMVAFCLIVLLFILSQKLNISKVVEPYSFIAFFLVFFIFIYGFVSTILNQMYRFDLLIELFVMVILFFIAKSISLSSFKYLLNSSYLVSSLLAIILMMDRGYVFSGGINYLLISMPLGLTAILSFSNTFTVANPVLKTIYLLCFLVCFSSLFYLQSRAVFLTTIVFILSTYIYYTFHKKNYIKSVFILFLVVFFVNSFSEIFATFYSESSLHNRLDSFLAGTSNEPRNDIYSNYFSNLDIFYFSGFGLGGTEIGLYSNSEEKYPHNFILELWSELGILGLLFGLFFLIQSFSKCLKLIFIERSGFILILFFMFFLMNFMKSFSIYQASILMISAGFLYNEKLFFKVKHRDTQVV